MAPAARANQHNRSEPPGVEGRQDVATDSMPKGDGDAIESWVALHLSRVRPVVGNCLTAEGVLPAGGALLKPRFAPVGDLLGASDGVSFIPPHG